MSKKSYEMDMCNGALFPKIISFSVPLMLSGILQLLFNAADVIVVGRYAEQGDSALAAVGATGALINLLTNLFLGLSVGANVMVARYFGAGQKKDADETVHTSILVSIIAGFMLMVIGLLFAKPILVLMNTHEDVLDKAVLYIRIYFLGMPIMLLYNFGSSVLRAVGDTKRPLIYLSIAGVVNVMLNMFFVMVLKMDVAGVACATVISQLISALLVVRCMIKSEGVCNLRLKDLKIHKRKLFEISRIGLPAGIQGSIFSISNVLIQSSINSFNSVTIMAANTSAANIEGFMYVVMNSVHQAGVSFTSQNYGAGRFDRIKRIVFICLGTVAVVSIALGVFLYLNSETFLDLYSPGKAEVIEYGIRRMRIICLTSFLCGMMDVLVGIIRGLGYSIMPMITSLLGVCAFRVVWIFTIFRWKHTLEILYVSYPISWIMTTLAHLICLMCVWKKTKSEHGLVPKEGR